MTVSKDDTGNKSVNLKREVGTFSERLRVLVGDRSARSFAAELNISSSGLHQYLTGKSDPTRTVLSLIADKTGVCLQWLVDGTGPILKSDYLADLAEPPIFTITNLEGRQVEFQPSPDLRHIPVLTVEAACGKGTFIYPEDVRAVFSSTDAWFRRELGANPENLVLIQARGDSMANTIMPEEMVFVDRSCIVEPCDGIWVFRNEDALFIKRLQFMPGRKIKVKSDNPAYDTFELQPDSTFSLLGQVIAALPLRRL
ncbi:MAG: S24 family peptidase [Candidatus Riflebacteria bacterium]|nr:S24 family peptidase [Candidatus Riflebacteria bacterium]